MAAVRLARAAIDDLDRMIVVLSLPSDTRERVRTALEPLCDFPRMGRELDGRWAGLRVLLGPWRWMLLVYAFDDAADAVTVVTIEDARSATRP